MSGLGSFPKTGGKNTRAKFKEPKKSPFRDVKFELRSQGGLVERLRGL